MLVEVQPAIAAGDRVGILASSVCEIIQRMRTTQRLQRGDHIFSDLTFVEPAATVRGDAPQCLGLGGCAENLPRFGGLAIKQEQIAGAARQVAHGIRPVGGDTLSDRDTRLGIVDRGCQYCLQAKLPPVLGQAAKGINSPRHAHGIGREQRDGVTFGPQRFRINSCRRAPRSVQRHHPVFARWRHQHKAVTADPGHLWLAQPQQNRPGDGRIHGIAACLHCLDRDFCGQRV